MEEEHDRPLPPPPPSPRTKSLPTPDVPLPDPRMFLPPEYLTSTTSSIIPRKRPREKARPLPPDFFSSKTAQDIARRALTHSPSPSRPPPPYPRPSLIASPPPKQLPIPPSSYSPTSSSTRPTRPHIHITYKQCSHVENIILSSPPSSGPATPDKSAATNATTTTTTTLDPPTNPTLAPALGPPTTKTAATPDHRSRCLPHKCPSCSRLDAIRAELAIRSRYRARIRSLEYWIAGLRPRKEESGTAVHCALYEARVLKWRDLRDVKALRGWEVERAWREYEGVHGLRGDREECLSEEEEGGLKTGSSLENSSEGLGLMSVSGSGGGDSVAVISDEEEGEGDGTMIVQVDHDGAQVDRDGDVQMTDCGGDDDQTRRKSENKAPRSPKETMEMSRNRVMDWKVDDDTVDQVARRKLEAGEKGEYAKDMDQQIARLKDRLRERQLKNEQLKAEKRTLSEGDTPEAEQAERGLISKVVGGRGSKWKTI